MDANTLLENLQILGCILRVEDTTLHISPSSLLTPELRAHIREHKAALLGYETVQRYRLKRQAGRPRKETPK